MLAAQHSIIYLSYLQSFSYTKNESAYLADSSHLLAHTPKV
jgi:hypothetical protein